MISELLKNSLPLYDLILPVSKKKVKFRPMTVKDEKILLLAQNTKSSVEIANAVIQIIERCFDIKSPQTLPIADIEKAFLELRAKSMGEQVSFLLRIDENKKINLTVNLNEFAIEGEPVDSHSIKINNDMVLILKSPDFSSICEKPYDDEIQIYKVLFKNCFKELQTKENTYKPEDVQDDDLFQFYDYMTSEQLNEFKKFIQKIPRFKKTIEYDDGEGNKKSITLMGIDSFFAYASAT